MSITKRGLIWEVLNSLWIGFSFLGFSFLSFMYIGIKSKTTKWKVEAAIYFLAYVLSIVAIVIFPISIATIFALIWLLSMFIGIVRSFLVRKEYLVRRDYILKSGIEEDDLDELRKSVKKEYKGKDYIESSGNDTQFDSTYHSQMGYRDYDTVTAKPEVEDKPYYDENIIKGNEEIFDNSNYVPYSKENTGNTAAINVNTCSAEEISSLPGVDLEIAQKAVALRDMLGGFNSVQEFIDMMNIEPSYSNDIKQKATVEEKTMN